MNSSRQITRQLDVLRTLAARRYGVEVGELAGEFGVSRRTLQRDLRDLGDAGFAVYNERRDGQRVYWYLRRDAGLPPVNFPLVEVAALLFVENALDALEGTPFKAYLGEALRRIELSLPEETRAFLRQAVQRYAPHVRGQKSYAGQEEIIETLNQALLECRVCQVRYRAIGRDEAKAYPIEPLRLFYFQGGLYLIARQPRHDRIITLAVERIEDLALAEDRFEVPENLQAELEQRQQQAFGIHCEDPIEVKVRFPPREAPYIKERVWHPSQRVEEQEDGSLVLSLRAGGFWEIKRWILGFGPDAQVLAPESLRQAVKKDLQDALRGYNKEL